MVLLCIVTAVFFFLFADGYKFSRTWKLAIKICGTISMICGALLFTPLHNVLIGVASLFALVPIVGIFKGLITYGSRLHLGLGILVLVLLALCNVLYYLSWCIEWLPLVQKIALAVTLLWIYIMSRSLMKDSAASPA